ncbi:uncharacterized protein [Cherax quadricarinatus]|uniref:uncharacterized protein n=1 Tax=Cherax quadricarinatus TaxID=27406 RepID=UPI00387E9E3B
MSWRLRYVLWWYCWCAASWGSGVGSEGVSWAAAHIYHKSCFSAAVSGCLFPSLLVMINLNWHNDNVISMANFVETDSPLPTPTFSRKFSGLCSNDSERQPESKNTQQFVRKCCVRRKVNVQTEGVIRSGNGGNSGSKTKRLRKKENVSDTIIPTLYRVINTSPSHSPRNSTNTHNTSTKTKIPVPTCSISSQSRRPYRCTSGTDGSNGTDQLTDVLRSAGTKHSKAQEISRKASLNISSLNVCNSGHRTSPVQIKDAISERAKHISVSKHYTTRTGESSEDSEDDIGGHDNVVAISYKQYDISGKCWQFVADRTTEMEVFVGTHKNAVLTENVEKMKRENEMKKKNSVCKAKNKRDFEVQLHDYNGNMSNTSEQRHKQSLVDNSLKDGIGDVLQTLNAKVRDSGLSPACFSTTNSQSTENNSKIVSSISKDMYDRSSIIMEQELTRSEKKPLYTSEHTVTNPHRGNRSVRYPARGSASQDTDINNTLNYKEWMLGPLSSAESEIKSKVTSSKIIGDEGPWQHTSEDCKFDSETKSQPGLGKTCNVEPEIMQGQKLNNEKFQESLDNTLAMTLSLDHNWKSNPGRFSFDNIVNICSKTVASSIRHCIAESPNEVPVNVKDIGLERGAAIFGGIIKGFVATLPSDVNTNLENGGDAPKTLLSYVEETVGEVHSLGKKTDSNSDIDTIQQVCDRFKSTKDLTTLSQDEVDVSTNKESVSESWAGDAVTDTHTNNSVSALPSFSRMDEPKIHSRRGSVDIQESSRIRLSKTGRIEVIDANMIDEDSEQVNEEGQDETLKDNRSGCSVSYDDKSIATARRSSFTERFNMWRLSWNLKNDSQPPSRSESLKLRLQQRRASVSDFTSSFDNRRNTFSGTFNDLYLLGQNIKKSSTVETPRLKRKLCLDVPPTRRGSVSSLTLFRTSSDTVPVIRRHSVDERSRKVITMEKASVEKASDAFSYFFEYPVLQQDRHMASAEKKRRRCSMNTRDSDLEMRGAILAKKLRDHSVSSEEEEDPTHIVADLTVPTMEPANMETRGNKRPTPQEPRRMDHCGQEEEAPSVQ